MTEPEFQIYQCSNESCRFRCPNNLTERKMVRCPLCGEELIPQGVPFINSKRHSDNSTNVSSQSVFVAVLLDNLRSTLNVGSIFRTADGAGVEKIYCCGTTPTPLHPKIAKTSLGAEELIPWTYATNALDLVKAKQQAGYQIFSLEASESSESILSKVVLNENKSILLVVGNEVSGVDPEILEISDRVFYIPMRGQKTSLNVAVAFGIAIYSLRI
jgi:23S rRNA (guanosine2251-2'-O)-methyltransferase